MKIYDTWITVASFSINVECPELFSINIVVYQATIKIRVQMFLDEYLFYLPKK